MTRFDGIGNGNGGKYMSAASSSADDCFHGDDGFIILLKVMDAN